MASVKDKKLVSFADMVVTENLKRFKSILEPKKPNLADMIKDELKRIEKKNKKK